MRGGTIIIGNGLMVTLPAALYWAGLLSPLATILALCVASLILGIGFVPRIPDQRLAVPMLLFWLGNFLFMQLAPLVFVLTDLSFLSGSSPASGFALVVIDASFTPLAVFSIFLLSARPHTQLHYSNSLPSLADSRQIFKLRVYSLLLILIGVIGAYWTGFVRVDENFSSYAIVSQELSGRGVQLRLAEFLALGGVLLIIISPHRRILKYLGILALLAYCVWRAGYGGRENAVKYLMILWLCFLLMANAGITRRTVLKLLAYSLIGAIALPIAGVIRTGLPLDLGSYAFIALRDFGYSEVAATLLQGNVNWSPPGILVGLRDAMNALLPRALYPDKAEAAAKVITGLVTPVANYYENGQQFAYAPSYVGQAAYWSPELHLPLAVILASITTLGVAWLSRAQRGRSWAAAKMSVVLYSVITFELYFSSVKLELYNLIGGSILLFAAVGIGVLVVKIRSAR